MILPSPPENIQLGHKLQATERPTKQEVQRRTAPKVHDGNGEGDGDGDGDGDKDEDVDDQQGTKTKTKGGINVLGRARTEGTRA